MINQKMTNKEAKRETKNKNLVEFFNGSFFGIPRNIIEARKKMRKASAFIIQDHLFAYFSSETGQRLGYKHFFTQQLAKELELDRRVFREGFKEIEEAGIYKIFDFKQKGKIVFFENEYTQDLIEKIEAGKLFINIDMKLNIRISDKKLEYKIINFPSNEVEQIPPQGGANPTTIVEQIPPQGGANPTTIVEQIPPQGGANPTTLTNAKTFDWSNWEADLKKPQEAYIKEAIYKESYHIDSSNLDAEIMTSNSKNHYEMNDDINKNLVREEKNSDDKITSFYLDEMIDLGIYESTAKKYISKLSTDDIQKAFDKLEAAKDSGHYIKNEGNFIRETLESMIDPNFKRSFSIPEKEDRAIPVPEKINATTKNDLEDAVNKYLDIFMPNSKKVVHNANTRIDDLGRKIIGIYEYCILEESTDFDEINQERDRFTAIMRDIKADSNNKIKSVLFENYNNPFMNKKLENGQKIMDSFINWFEGII